MNPHPNQADLFSQRVAWLLLPLMALCMDVLTWWPGHVSFDAAHAWWQARGGVTTNTTPPVFVAMWRMVNAVSDGPQGMFFLHSLMYWVGAALWLHALTPRLWQACVFVLLLCFAPVLFVLRSHVWTDVGMMSALFLAAGFLLLGQTQRDQTWAKKLAVAAWPCLMYALMLRHNALPAIVPLLWWSLTLMLPRSRWPMRAIATMLWVFAMLFGSQTLNRNVDVSVPVWPSLAQFDIVGVSTQTHEMLLPHFMVGDGMTADELANAHEPWSNIPVLSNTTHGMRQPFDPSLTSDELTQLKQTWWQTIRNHPRAWCQHRWLLSQALFGRKKPSWPHELMYVDAMVPYQNNPPLSKPSGWLYQNVMTWVKRHQYTHWFAAWPWLLLGCIAFTLMCFRHTEPLQTASRMLFASAVLYTLPLLVIAPAAELRYLGWPLLVAVTMLGMLFAGWRLPTQSGTKPLPSPT